MYFASACADPYRSATGKITRVGATDMAVGAAISSPSSEPGSRWIGSPEWDLFWMFSAFSAAALAAMLVLAARRRSAGNHE